MTLTDDQLQKLEEELLFTEDRIADALEILGFQANPADVERQLSLQICADCGYWVYEETVVNELCIDCQEESG